MHWTPRRIASAAAAGALLLSYLLVQFPPSLYPFYPPCIFKAITGYDCPGCGLTRALAALLMGRFREAVSYNLLAVALVPPALILLTAQASSALRRNLWLMLRIPVSVTAGLVTLTTVFGIARNIPR